MQQPVEEYAAMGPRRDLRREVGILSRKLYFNAGAFTGEERDHLNKRIAVQLWWRLKLLC